MSEAVERVARALCRFTWGREFAGQNLDAYVEIHWKDHVPAAGVAIAALQDDDREKWVQPSGRAKDAWEAYKAQQEGAPIEECTNATEPEQAT